MSKVNILEITPCGDDCRKNVEAGKMGACVEVLNLRERDECLEVVGDCKPLGSLGSNEKLVLIDHRGDSDYYLTVLDDNIVRVHGIMCNGSYDYRGETVCSCGGNVRRAEQSGDFVVLLTDCGVEYLSFNGENYVSLNVDDALPMLIVDTADTVSVDVDVPSFSLSGGYGQWVRPLCADDEKKLKRAMKDAYATLVEREAQNGKKVQPVAVRYGVRLWDDSYLWMSAPVVVGNGLQLTSRVTAEVSSDFQTVAGTVMEAKSYKIGVVAVKGTSAEWDARIKSVDVYVTDEVMPFVSPMTVDYRCETTQTGSRRYYLSAQFEQKDSANVRAALINPSSWRLMCSITDLESLRSGQIVAPQSRLATVAQGGALSSRVYSLADVKAYTTLLHEEDVCRINSSVNGNDIPVASAVCDGRWHCGGGMRRLSMPWSAVNFWKSKVDAVPCDVKMTVRLKTLQGQSVVTKSERLSYTPYELGALVAYPDVRATDMTITVSNSTGTRCWKGVLQAAPECGMAYSLSDDFVVNTLADSTSDESVSERLTESTPSRVAIWAKDNPFVKTESRNVGAGTVQHLAVACRAIYSSVFGRYPLYAFTSEGIYAIAYKTYSDYRDVQLIDRRRMLASVPSCVSADAVYFVNDQHELCHVVGKNVVTDLCDVDVQQMTWNRKENELWTMSATGKVKVLLPSGRTYSRDEVAKDLYGNYHDAVVVSVDGMMSDVRQEMPSTRKIAMHTYAINPSKSLLLTPVRVSWNMTLTEANIKAKLGGIGENGNGKDLHKPLLIAGDNDGKSSVRLFSTPQRLVAYTINGTAKSGSQIKTCEVIYLTKNE